MASQQSNINFLQDTVLEYNTVCEQLKAIEEQIAPLKMLKSGVMSCLYCGRSFSGAN